MYYCKVPNCIVFDHQKNTDFRNMGILILPAILSAHSLKGV